MCSRVPIGRRLRVQRHAGRPSPEPGRPVTARAAPVVDRLPLGEIQGALGQLELGLVAERRGESLLQRIDRRGRPLGGDRGRRSSRGAPAPAAAFDPDSRSAARCASTRKSFASWILLRADQPTLSVDRLPVLLDGDADDVRDAARRVLLRRRGRGAQTGGDRSRNRLRIGRRLLIAEEMYRDLQRRRHANTMARHRHRRTTEPAPVPCSAAARRAPREVAADVVRGGERPPQRLDPGLPRLGESARRRRRAAPARRARATPPAAARSRRALLADRARATAGLRRCRASPPPSPPARSARSSVAPWNAWTTSRPSAREARTRAAISGAKIASCAASSPDRGPRRASAAIARARAARRQALDDVERPSPASSASEIAARSPGAVLVALSRSRGGDRW